MTPEELNDFTRLFSYARRRITEECDVVSTIVAALRLAWAERDAAQQQLQALRAEHTTLTGAVREAAFRRSLPETAVSITYGAEMPWRTNPDGVEFDPETLSPQQ